MTDYERFIYLLRSFEVDFQEVKGPDRFKGIPRIVGPALPEEAEEDEDEDMLLVYIDGGYAGFYQRWAFDLDGKFIDSGSYE